MYAIKGDKLKM